VEIPWKILLFFLGELCDDEPMPSTRQLRDVYRFPGFVPLATVHGIFGDSHAVVVTLQRREKKQPAGRVAKFRTPFTINGRGMFGTFPVATSGSISTSPFVGFSAHGVAL
jgi:hypothetical protein